MQPKKLQKKKFLKFWDCFSEKEVFGQNITKLGKKKENSTSSCKWGTIYNFAP
jgi:hypothetical protein